MCEIVTGEHVARVAVNYPGGWIRELDDIVALVDFVCGDAAGRLSGTVITVRPPIVG